MEPITVKTAAGEERLLNLRKVPLHLLGLLVGELADEEKALLAIAPEGRDPEEVRKVYQELDEESQFEIWAQGMELNEKNLSRFTERKKKLAAAGGLNVEKMVEKAMEKKMDDFMESADFAKMVTDSKTSSTTTPPTSSPTLVPDIKE